MAHPQEDRADRLMIDVIRLAYALNAVSSRDWPDSIAEAVRQGYMRLAELLTRRTAVSLTREDEKLIDSIMEVIRARLNFLEKLHRLSLPN